MKTRVTLKRPKKHFKIKRIRFLIWSIFFSMLFSIILLFFIGKKLNPILLRYLNAETERFATTIINSAVTTDELDTIDNLYIITKSSDGEIQTIDFNTVKVNEILESITKKIQKIMLELEEGNSEKMDIPTTFKGTKFLDLKHGVVCEVTIGSLLGNAIFSNFGPSIPIKLNFIGQVNSYVNTKIETYGINSAYLEVSIHVEVTERIVMPLYTEEKVIETDIPISMKIIQGKIPNYYNEILDKNSSIFSLPIE